MRSMIADAELTEPELRCIKATLPIVGSGRIITPFADHSFDQLAPFIREQPYGKGIIFIESDIGRAWHYLAKKRELPVTMCRHGMAGYAEAAAFREFHENPRCVLLTNASALTWDRFPDINWAMHYDPPACIEDWVSDISRIGRYGRTTYLSIRISDEAWAERKRQIDKMFLVRIDPVQDVWKSAAYDRLEQLRQVFTTHPISDIPSRIDQHFSELLPDCVATKMALAVRTGSPCGWAARPVYGQMQSGLVDPQELADLVGRVSPALVGYACDGNRKNQRIADELLNICEERGLPYSAWRRPKGYRASSKESSASKIESNVVSHNRRSDVGNVAFVEDEARWLVLAVSQTLVPGWAIADGSWARHDEGLVGMNKDSAGSSGQCKQHRNIETEGFMMVKSRRSTRKPPSVKGAALYRRLAAEAKTLSVHLDDLCKARKQIDAAEDETHRREATGVVREAIKDFRLAQQSLDHAIAESREHFGLQRG